jgi:hypothetical protein
MTDYPNPEHRRADSAACRRALAALDELENEVRVLRRRIEGGTAEGDDTHLLAEKARSVTQHVTALGVLREVREWDAADGPEVRCISATETLAAVARHRAEARSAGA